jgi:hypothetical protein
MSLQDPSIRLEFVARVLSVIPQEYRRFVDPRTLNEFVEIISAQKKNPFPILLIDAMRWLKIRDGNARSCRTNHL